MAGRLWKRTGSVIAILISGALAVPAQVKTLDTEISDKIISVGDSATLTIKLTPEYGDAKPVKVPGVAGLEIQFSGQRQYYQFGTGGSRSERSLTFSVTALKKGSYKIPPFILDSDGTLLKTKEVNLVVTGSTARAGSDEGNAVLASEVTASRATAYLGEPVIVRYYLLSSGLGNVYEEGLSRKPEGRGFMIQPADEVIESGMVTRDGYDLARIHKLTRVFIPTQTGELSAGGGEFTVVTVGNDFFRRTRQLRTSFDTKPVKVLPLPEKGKPAGFQGNVGSFTMKAEYPREEMKAYTEKHVIITVGGEGNLYALSRPEHRGNDRNLRVIVEEGEREIKLDGDRVRGRAVFNATIIPEAEGSIDAGEFVFQFFNPADKSYHELKSGNIVLDVKGGGKEGPRLDFDEDTSHKIDFNPLYIALIVLAALAGIIAIVIWERRRYRIVSGENNVKEEEPDKNEGKQYIKSLEKDLSEALFKKDGDLFFRTVDRIVGLVRDEKVEKGRLKVSPEELLSIRDRLYASRFGGGGISDSDMKEIAGIIRGSGVLG